MIYQVHKDAVIGIKKLSEADLGTGLTSNQTHIGLFDRTLNFLTEEHQIISSQLIYETRVFELLSLLDYIRNPDGSYRSPKIRKGNEYELIVGDSRVNSVVREINEIIQISPRDDWYLLWLGLDTNELVFLLIKTGSRDFNEISRIVGTIGIRQQIDSTSSQFIPIVSFLNRKIESVNIQYYEELEIASQTGEERVSRRIIPRVRDIEKANKLFKETGIKGEELLYKYFEQQKSNSEIKDFKWMNQSKESGMPYDFEIRNQDNSLMFSDAKSTNFKFELPIVVSSGELQFINENKHRYLIHRLYSINEEPKLRVCDNIHMVSDIFMPNYEILKETLSKDNLVVNGIKLTVPTDLEILNFNNEILLNASS